MFKFIALSLVLGAVNANYGRHYHSIELPVYSKASREVIHSPSHREHQSTYVEIPGGVMPVYLTFKSQSSPVYVKQEHKGTKGSYQKSDSQDEPHKLVHEVVKPVYQELQEIIEPYRKVIQIIKPVNEEVVTKVHKSEHKKYGGDDEGYGYRMKEYKKDDFKEDDYKKDDYKEDDNKNVYKYSPVLKMVQYKRDQDDDGDYKREDDNKYKARSGLAPLPVYRF